MQGDETTSGQTRQFRESAATRAPSGSKDPQLYLGDRALVKKIHGGDKRRKERVINPSRDALGGREGHGTLALGGGCKKKKVGETDWAG